jgi:nicotinic acid mononucleotide adenylyltransferase
MMGTDLIPGLKKWDNGQQLLDEINFIIFDRKGFEDVLNTKVKKDYQMPKSYEVLPANLNLIGMISSTEVRRRINEAKM